MNAGNPQARGRFRANVDRRTVRCSDDTNMQFAYSSRFSVARHRIRCNCIGKISTSSRSATVRLHDPYHLDQGSLPKTTLPELTGLGPRRNLQHGSLVGARQLPGISRDQKIVTGKSDVADPLVESRKQIFEIDLWKRARRQRLGCLLHLAREIPAAMYRLRNRCHIPK